MNKNTFVVPPILRLATGVMLGVAFLAYATMAPLWTEASTTTDPMSTARSQPAETTAEGVYDFREHLSDARVRYGDHECTQWTGNRWDCGLEPWLWVGKHQGRISTPSGPQWRACIWAHAESRNGRALPLSITWSDVRWTGTLVGDVGMLDTPIPGGPAQFRVLVDGKQRASSRVTNAANRRDHERQWKGWSVRDKAMGQKTREVSFEITASEGAWRQLCFSARMEPEGI